MDSDQLKRVPSPERCRGPLGSSGGRANGNAHGNKIGLREFSEAGLRNRLPCHDTVLTSGTAKPSSMMTKEWDCRTSRIGHEPRHRIQYLRVDGWSAGALGAGGCCVHPLSPQFPRGATLSEWDRIDLGHFGAGENAAKTPAQKIAGTYI